jgi:predicted DNA-binding transcriptional regulator AlpA
MQNMEASTLNRARGTQTHLLTEKELAASLGVSLAACRKWRTQDRGPVFVKLGSLVRYRSADVEQWVTTRPKGGEVLNVAPEVGGLQ